MLRQYKSQSGLQIQVDDNHISRMALEKAGGEQASHDSERISKNNSSSWSCKLRDAKLSGRLARSRDRTIVIYSGLIVGGPTIVRTTDE